MSVLPKKATNNYVWLENYPDEYIDCRVDRHTWVRPHVIDPALNVPWGYPIYRTCKKCGAWWIRSFDRAVSRKIYERRTYPPGYLLKGVGHSTKQRSLMFLREMIEREDVEYVEKQQWKKT